MKTTVVLLALLGLFGLAGTMDYEDQQAEQAHYCDMVKAGHWPDFQGTYQSECRTPKSVPR
jgi:hypothetical protein